LPDAPADREAVDVRKPDVEQGDRRSVLGDQLQPTLAAGSLQHAEAGLAQIEVEQVGDVRVVLDHHDAALVAGHVAHRGTLLASPAGARARTNDAGLGVHGRRCGVTTRRMWMSQVAVWARIP